MPRDALVATPAFARPLCAKQSVCLKWVQLLGEKKNPKLGFQGKGNDQKQHSTPGTAESALAQRSLRHPLNHPPGARQHRLHRPGSHRRALTQLPLPMEKPVRLSTVALPTPRVPAGEEGLSSCWCHAEGRRGWGQTRRGGSWSSLYPPPHDHLETGDGCHLPLPRVSPLTPRPRCDKRGSSQC